MLRANSRIDEHGEGLIEISLSLAAWLSGGDTGTSSRNIARRYLGLPIMRQLNGYPHDGDDFGRCYRLLIACPEIDIRGMKGFHKIWDALVDNWKFLTQKYELSEVKLMELNTKCVQEPKSPPCSDSEEKPQLNDRIRSILNNVVVICNQIEVKDYDNSTLSHAAVDGVITQATLQLNNLFSSELYNLAKNMNSTG